MANRLEAITNRLEAIANRLEAIAISNSNEYIYIYTVLLFYRFLMYSKFTDRQRLPNDNRSFPANIPRVAVLTSGARSKGRHKFHR